MFFATDRMLRTGLFLGLSLTLSFTAGMAFGQTTIKYENGSSPTTLPGVTVTADPPTTLPQVTVTANVPGGVFIPSAGKGAVYNGHEFETANTHASVNTNKDDCDHAADPILPKTGSKVETYPLFTLPGEMALGQTKGMRRTTRAVVMRVGNAAKTAKRGGTARERLSL